MYQPFFVDFANRRFTKTRDQTKSRQALSSAKNRSLSREYDMILPCARMYIRHTKSDVASHAQSGSCCHSKVSAIQNQCMPPPLLSHATLERGNTMLPENAHDLRMPFSPMHSPVRPARADGKSFDHGHDQHVRSHHEPN
jgi:hypothetical protein